jgi:hypothetical protein
MHRDVHHEIQGFKDDVGSTITIGAGSIQSAPRLSLSLKKLRKLLKNCHSGGMHIIHVGIRYYLRHAQVMYYQ